MPEIALVADLGRATLYCDLESREILVQSLARKRFEETDVLVKPIKARDSRGRNVLEASIDV